MEHQRTPKRKIPKWNMSIFQNKKFTSWTLINSLFVCPSITEMTIGMMMKVIQTLTICTNMKNIHILTSYIDAILVPSISSMHAYPQKRPYNTKQTHIHMMLHPNV
jgi:hypothetical protein